MRLQKFLAHAGIASRRAAERLILAGRVSVNGEIVTKLGSQVNPAVDCVQVDGRLVHLSQRRVYIALHKPAGYVTTVSDPQGRPTVLSLLSGVRERVYPVGRLDLESEGLLLLTNDGELAHLLTHPRYHIPRIYRVWVEGVPSDETLRVFSRGILLEDGVTAPARAELIKKTTSSAVLEITLHEGKKRQVRRMCAALGHPVRRLVRIAFGPLTLGDLPPGRWRYLTSGEVSALYAAVNLVKGEPFVLE